MSAEALRVGAQTLAAAYPEVGASADELLSLLRACRLRSYADGEDLCVEGEPSQLLYIVLDGIVQVERANDGAPIRIEVRAPTLLGTMGIVDRSRRTATCTAIRGPVLAATMDRDVFRTLIRGTDGRGIALRRLMLTVLTQQLIDGNDRLRTLVASADRHGAGDPLRSALLRAGR